MALAPTAYKSQQYENFGGFFLKFFQQGTPTPLSMATDSTGATTLAKAEISSGGTIPVGFIKTAGDVIFIPWVDGAYDGWLFPTAADADANDTTNAIQIANDINADPNATLNTVISNFTNVEYDSVAALVSSQAPLDSTATTISYHAGWEATVGGPSGRATYQIVTKAQHDIVRGTGTVDELGDHTLTNGNVALLAPEEGIVLVDQYGAGSAQSGAVNSAAFQAAVNAFAKIDMTQGVDYDLATRVSTTRTEVEITGFNNFLTTTDVNGCFKFENCLKVTLKGFHPIGNNNTGQAINSLVGIELLNIQRIEMDNIEPRWYQSGIKVHKTDSGAPDSISTKLSNSTLRDNDINLELEFTPSTATRVYAITLENVTSHLAWGRSDGGRSGRGIQATFIKELTLINSVVQSNGYNGVSNAGGPISDPTIYGFGTGLELDRCRRVKTLNFLSENHHSLNAPGSPDSYDVRVTGTASVISEQIYIDGAVLDAKTEFCSDVEFDVERLVRLDVGTDADNVRNKNSTPNPTFPAGQEITVRAYQGRSLNSKVNSIYGNIIDGRDILAPTRSSGVMTNNFGRTLNMHSDGAWSDSGATRTSPKTVEGPHGLKDEAVMNVAYAAQFDWTEHATPSPDNWNGTKCGGAWLKSSTPLALMRIHLKIAGGADIVSQEFKIKDTWELFPITGFDAGAGNISMRLTNTTVSGAAAFDMYLPFNVNSSTPTAVYHSPDGGPDGRRAVEYFSGGASIGPYPARQVTLNAIPTSGAWNRGDIVWNASPVAGGKIGWSATADVADAAVDNSAFKAFGVIDA